MAELALLPEVRCRPNEVLMKQAFSFAVLLMISFSAAAQDYGSWLAGLPQPRNYVQSRASSYDRTGGNDDYRQIAPGESLTLLDQAGPALISHIWVTIAGAEIHHLKALVLRMYWDGESTPSVEAPIGDFFGLGLGSYFLYESAPLSVGSDKALNCFFPMPFQRHARITVTNEGSEKVKWFYFNIDYRRYAKPLAADTLYFHAQYRQAAPSKGESSLGTHNESPGVEGVKNLTGKGNYVWMEASGRGHYVGVTMSVLQNQRDWWGEGDDMFFVDGETTPSINGTGSEDYFLGAWDFGNQAFSYALYGAPVKGTNEPGARWSVYRFHLDSPITFTKSLRATIEHGHANDRSDNFFSVAYWYQTEPHAAFPVLPTLEQRIPRLYAPGGPGKGGREIP
jgi:hypothetical protein